MGSQDVEQAQADARVLWPVRLVKQQVFAWVNFMISESLELQPCDARVCVYARRARTNHEQLQAKLSGCQV